MNGRQVCPQGVFKAEAFRADVTLEDFTLAYAMSGIHVPVKMSFPIKDPRADVADKRLDVTNTVNSSQVQAHAVCLCKLPAANFTRVLGVRMLWSWRRRRSGVPLRMRRVVVSADR